MRISISPDRLPAIERELEGAAPWMHPFRFAERVIVGYYKFTNLGWETTWCNSASCPEIIRRMIEAYEAIDHTGQQTFLNGVFDSLDLDRDRHQSTILDIASATGKNSFIAAEWGFGHVVSSEIRRKSHQQQGLILSNASDARYRSVEAVNDPVSADSPEFPERYQQLKPDVVMSFGLLYHLVEPVQFLLNLRQMTGRFVILSTMTHDIRGAEDAWRLLIEKNSELTKAIGGISWTPHFYGLTKLLKQVGFRRCTIHYPTIYARNHPNFESGYVPRGGRIRDQLLARIGIHTRLWRERERYLSSFAPSTYVHRDIMPGNFCYVLEK